VKLARIAGVPREAAIAAGVLVALVLLAAMAPDI
jgi:hypothetical protein